MKKILLVIIAISMLSACQKGVENDSTAQIPVKVTFPSLDSLPVTANLYHYGDDAPVIVLCHQAGLNKVEYVKIAEMLFLKGFNCISIDQRSGGHLVEWFNETMLKAVEKGKPVGYLDAEQDIITAVDFAAKKYKKKVILWGSSYSATLALYLAAENENIETAIAFSPGDYFAEQKKSLQEKLKGFKKPMFITSSKDEAVEVTKMLSNIHLNENQVHFIPESKGIHGSRALWKTYENNQEYWRAINDFLVTLKVNVSEKI